MNELLAIHSRIRMLAARHGVPTDLVMMAIGIEEQDLGLMLDPLIAEKLKAMQMAAPLETLVAVRRDVRDFLDSLADFGIERRGRNMPDYPPRM